MVWLLAALFLDMSANEITGLAGGDTGLEGDFVTHEKSKLTVGGWRVYVEITSIVEVSDNLLLAPGRGMPMWKGFRGYDEVNNGDCGRRQPRVFEFALGGGNQRGNQANNEYDGKA